MLHRTLRKYTWCEICRKGSTGKRHLNDVFRTLATEYPWKEADRWGLVLISACLDSSRCHWSDVFQQRPRQKTAAPHCRPWTRSPGLWTIPRCRDRWNNCRARWNRSQGETSKTHLSPHLRLIRDLLPLAEALGVLFLGEGCVSYTQSISYDLHFDLYHDLISITYGFSLSDINLWKLVVLFIRYGCRFFFFFIAEVDEGNDRMRNCDFL